MDAKTFKTERLQLGLSQTDMATRLGVCLRTIGYYEAGEKPIPDSIRLLHNCLKRKVILEKDIELAKWKIKEDREETKITIKYYLVVQQKLA